MEPNKIEKLEWIAVKDVPVDTGIAHVIRSLFLLGWITKEEYERRVKNAPES